MVDAGLAVVTAQMPDVAVVGLHFRQGSGFGLIRALLAARPQTRVIVFTSVESDAYAQHCLGLGARGYICKSEPIESLMQAIGRVMEGRFYLRDSLHDDLMTRVFQRRSQGNSISIDALSPGELEVFDLIGRGLSNPEISKRLDRSIKTIETYRTRIKSKLGMRTAIELSQFAFEQVGAS